MTSSCIFATPDSQPGRLAENHIPSTDALFHDRRLLTDYSPSLASLLRHVPFFVSGQSERDPCHIRSSCSCRICARLPQKPPIRHIVDPLPQLNPTSPFTIRTAPTLPPTPAILSFLLGTTFLPLAPSPSLTAALRHQQGESALRPLPPVLLTKIFNT